VSNFSAEHSFRRLIAGIAIVAMLLQTLFAAIASAHALGAPDAAIGVICHGAGSTGLDTGPAPGGAPDVDRTQACCLFCAAAVAEAAKNPLTIAGLAPRPAAIAPPSLNHEIVIARAVVRAGRSQAPPSLA
jgi:hypothetical protein